EGVMLENPEDAIAKIKQIKKLGVRFALDDFGTGYSSLQYLKQLPIDQIKIDQSFIRDIETDINNAAIVKTIIAMSHAMGLEVIAEGVETQAQLDFLELNGCLHYQGYLFARPMPLSQLEALLQPGSSLAASLANATPLA
ncbi:MAG: EAL domain-containing protein, partial [Hylemonella sp.]|nr:EAL domain-containing protein [Hylemonella sp.]